MKKLIFISLLYVASSWAGDAQMVWHVNEDTDIFITNFKCPMKPKEIAEKYPYVAYAVNKNSHQIMAGCWRKESDELFELHWDGTKDTPVENTHYYFDALVPIEKTPPPKKPEPPKIGI